MVVSTFDSTIDHFFLLDSLGYYLEKKVPKYFLMVPFLLKKIGGSGPTNMFALCRIAVINLNPSYTLVHLQENCTLLILMLCYVDGTKSETYVLANSNFVSFITLHSFISKKYTSSIELTKWSWYSGWLVVHFVP